MGKKTTNVIWLALWVLRLRLTSFRYENWNFCVTPALQQPLLWKQAKTRRTQMTLQRPWTQFWEILLSLMCSCLMYGGLLEMSRTAESEHTVKRELLTLPSQSSHYFLNYNNTRVCSFTLITVKQQKLLHVQISPVDAFLNLEKEETKPQCSF